MGVTDATIKRSGLGRAVITGALAALVVAIVLIAGWTLVRSHAGMFYGGDGTVRQASNGGLVVDLGPIDLLHNGVHTFHLKRLTIPVGITFEVHPHVPTAPYALPNPIIHLKITSGDGRVAVDTRGMLREWNWEQRRPANGPVSMVARRDSSAAPPEGVVDQQQSGGGGTSFRPSPFSTYEIRLEVILGDQRAAATETHLLVEQE
jgi:hypothetical protein